MATGLQKPKSNVFRTFLYLDRDEVINTLAALEGGEVEEVLSRVAEEGGSDLGGELRLGAAAGKAAKKKQRRLEEEVRRRRTDFSATSAVLRLLHEQEAIGVLTGAYGDAVYEELEEQMLLEFRGSIRIHPLHQVVSAGRAFLAAAPTFGVARGELQAVRETVSMFEAMAQGGGARRTLLVFAETTSAQGQFRLVLPIQERYLIVPLDEFAGRATFVAQVDRILRDDESLLALRLLRSAPELPLERDGLLEALPDLISAFADFGINTEVADFVLTKPSVVLKPLVIYK